uniref:Uncharacterized protein n=1 Tax=Rhizophora mucronata TaxID=61149 RepID=A0A2P2NQB8_RHIMU
MNLMMLMNFLEVNFGQCLTNHI